MSAAPNDHPSTDVRTAAARFHQRFAGLKRSSGRYQIPPGAKPGDGGKLHDTKWAWTTKDPVTLDVWEKHLSGAQGVGIVPIRDDATCVFGAIDIDQYDPPLDHKVLVTSAKKLGLPLVVCRTKSGGGHLYLFLSSPASAVLVQSKLKSWAVALGHPGVEIFPKQTKLATEADYGNWINVPYCGGKRSTRYAIKADGTAMTPEEFLDVADNVAIAADELADWKLARADDADDDDGQFGDLLLEAPPCLQTLARKGFGDWQNNGLFNWAVYLRKRYENGWESRLPEYNRRFMDPPVDADGVKNIIKSVGKRKYSFMCKQEPICGVCNRQVCLTREFGIGKATRADALLNITEQATLFHTPDGVPYADIPVHGHRETWPVASKGFRDWVTRTFFEREKAAPSDYALKGMLGIIAAKARFDAPTRDVHVRIARLNGKIYLDLCDDAWRAVEIDDKGWRIVDRPAVRFRRARGMLSLPEPERGGKIEDLHPFLNVDDDGFTLTVGFILGALSGRGPYPILAVSGEQGSAKSTFCCMIRTLTDPNKVPLRALLRHDQDLYIAANNAHVLVFDNVSKLADWLSDTLCRLATGGGFSVRELYTDTDEVLFDGSRPVILNGIENFIERPDLADRVITLLLNEIPDDKRRTETDLWAEFEKARPKILGALLDAVSHGLREIADTTLGALPRMADFALWVAACEGEHLWEVGTFARVYAENRQSGQIELLEADPVGMAMLKFIARPPPKEKENDNTYRERIEREGGSWEGTAAELLMWLNGGSAGGTYVDEETRRDRRWPRTPKALAGRVRRMAPALRQARIAIDFHRTQGASLIMLARPPAKPPEIDLFGCTSQNPDVHQRAPDVHSTCTRTGGESL